MKYPNYYEVTFMTKKHGDRHWIIHVSNNNLNAAKKSACELWGKLENGMHMFHVHCRRLKYNEEFAYHWFKRIDK